MQKPILKAELSYELACSTMVGYFVAECSVAKGTSHVSETQLTEACTIDEARIAYILDQLELAVAVPMIGSISQKCRTYRKYSYRCHWDFVSTTFPPELWAGIAGLFHMFGFCTHVRRY